MPNQDNRQARSEATQQALMRAAEKLIAENGIENVTIRDILATAGQKNTSALQYHFSNFRGLIDALLASRHQQIQERRAALIKETLARTPEPPLREVCKLMVAPAFDLARSNPDFRRYVKAFGHDLTVAEESALTIANRTGGESAELTGTLLRKALPHLGEDAFVRRMEGALRFISASMVYHARQKNAFRGAEAELFFFSLIDGLVGLLSEPESEETRAQRERIEGRKV